MAKDTKVYTQEELDKKALRELKKIEKIQANLVSTQKALATNPQFVAFIKAQEKLEKQTKDFWDTIKQQMIDSGIKNLNGKNLDYDWGWITLGETFSYSVENIEEVPEEYVYDDLDIEALKSDIGKLNKKYIKKSVNVASIKEDVQLTGDVPDGVVEKVSYKLMKKINPPKEIIS